MEQKLDFSLPRAQEKKSAILVIVVVLLIVAVVLSAAGLYWAVKDRGPAQIGGVVLSENQVQDLAGKLSSRGLYERAATVLKDWAGRSGLGGAEKAKAMFQIGDLLASAGKYDEAVEYYYRSELFGKVVDERQMNAKLKECFEKMGKFAALEREIASRTSIGGEQKADAVVLAEIGTEKITAQKLDEMIEQQIADQMARYAAFMKPEQLAERKKEMVKQYTDPQTRQKFLEMWVGQEVLYREAMAKGLADKPEVKRTMETMAKAIAAEQAMNEEVGGKVSITETDVKTYYEAHKSEYVEQAKDPNSSPRQKTLDEVSDAVYQQLRGEKTRDVQQAYVKQLMDKYNVVIHGSTLAGKSKEPEAGSR
jgi:hypothetical protein